MKHKGLAALVSCYLKKPWGFDGLRCLSHLRDAVEAQCCSSGSDDLRGVYVNLSLLVCDVNMRYSEIYIETYRAIRYPKLESKHVAKSWVRNAPRELSQPDHTAQVLGRVKYPGIHHGEGKE